MVHAPVLTATPDTRLVVHAVRGVTYEALLGLVAVVQSEPTGSWADDVRMPAAVSKAVAAVGDTTGELWLHLLGCAMAVDADDPTSLVEHVRALEPVELREHLVGLHVPAWRQVVEPAVMAAAASGDTKAQDALLEADNYYAGVARDALETALRLGPDQTKRRVVAALSGWIDDVVLPRRGDLAAALDAGVTTATAGDPLVAIGDLTGGYRYQPEPGVDEVLVIENAALPDRLVLAQHDRTRIICAPLRQGGDRPWEESLADTFAALGEPNRLRILAALTRRPRGVTELADAVGLAKSTTHRHLRVLLDVGLVVLAGAAWRYRYEAEAGPVQLAVQELVDRLAQEDTS